MPIVKQYFRMLQRPILYTGLTRAKTIFSTIRRSKAFDIALNTQGQERHTQLKTLIINYFGMSHVNIDVEENDEPINIDDTEDNNADEHITLSEETIYQINPMINMGNVSP